MSTPAAGARRSLLETPPSTEPVAGPPVGAAERTRSPRRRYPAEAPATEPEANPRRMDRDIFSQFRIRDPERFAYNRRGNRTLERHGEQESNLSRILRREEANGNRCGEGSLYFAVVSAGSPIRGKFRRALVHPVGETRIIGAGSPDFPIRRNSETDERCRQARLGTESHLPDERTSARGRRGRDSRGISLPPIPWILSVRPFFVSPRTDARIEIRRTVELVEKSG